MPDRDSVRLRPETPSIAAVLALAGGSLDGIVFTLHGVFANAQTGNLVLLGIGLVAGRWSALVYAVPIVAFALGTLAAHGLARLRPVLKRPTRVVLGIEIGVLVALAAVPRAAPAAITVLLVAFAAALQAATFRSLSGQAYSTTMSTGNLRLFVLSLHRRLADRDHESGRVAGAVGVVLLAFAVGAGAGAWLARGSGSLALLGAAAALAVALTAIVVQSRRIAAAERQGTEQ